VSSLKALCCGIHPLKFESQTCICVTFTINLWNVYKKYRCQAHTLTYGLCACIYSPVLQEFYSDMKSCPNRITSSILVGIGVVHIVDL
jgi:hypothetical protein